MKKCIAVAAVSVVVIFGGGGAWAATPTMHIHCIDVGQGLATLVEFPCGAILVDTGSQGDEHTDHLKQYLTEFFRRRPDLNNTLSALIISHPHIDHTRGIRAVTSVCRVKAYIDNGILHGSGGREVNWIRDQVQQGALQTQIRTVTDDEITSLPHRHGLTDEIIDSIACADCDPKITILSSSMSSNPGWSQSDFADANNHSVVTRVDFGGASVLFIGDLEAPAHQTLVNYYRGTNSLDVDAIQVGHHCSHNGTTATLLEAATPEIAFIGVGRWDFGKDGGQFTTFAFGHPRRVAVDLLVANLSRDRVQPVRRKVFDAVASPRTMTIGKAIYATGWDGDIAIEAGLDGIHDVQVRDSGIIRRVTPSDQVAAAQAPSNAVAFPPPYDSVSPSEGVHAPAAAQPPSIQATNASVQTCTPCIPRRRVFLRRRCW